MLVSATLSDEVQQLKAMSARYKGYKTGTKDSVTESFFWRYFASELFFFPFRFS